MLKKKILVNRWRKKIEYMWKLLLYINSIRCMPRKVNSVCPLSHFIQLIIMNRCYTFYRDNCPFICMVETNVLKYETCPLRLCPAQHCMRALDHRTPGTTVYPQRPCTRNNRTPATTNRSPATTVYPLQPYTRNNRTPATTVHQQQPYTNNNRTPATTVQ